MLAEQQAIAKATFIQAAPVAAAILSIGIASRRGFARMPWQSVTIEAVAAGLAVWGGLSLYGVFLAVRVLGLGDRMTAHLSRTLRGRE